MSRIKISMKEKEFLNISEYIDAEIRNSDKKEGLCIVTVENPAAALLLAENSEDVLQEVMLRLSKKMPYFENEEHEKAWLIRVTINCSNTLLNSSFLKHKSELTDNLFIEEPEKHDVYYAVLALPLKYRTVIHLYYYEGYKIKEISKILKTKENTVKSQLLRAKEILKTSLEGGFDNE